MKKIVVISGGNKGLGKAFIDLALEDQNTIIVSLSRALHNDHADIGQEKLILVPTDLSKPFSDDFLKVIDPLINEDSRFFVFNNAGIILPINKIGSFSSTEIDISIAVNINYPVNLVNCFVSKYSGHDMTITNISSGAGNNPISHWSLYGAAKAYTSMLFKVLMDENKEKLSVYNIDPGVLDTGMQESIRENSFPRQHDFIAFKDKQMLTPPAVAASKIFKEINF